MISGLPARQTYKINKTILQPSAAQMPRLRVSPKEEYRTMTRNLENICWQGEETHTHTFHITYYSTVYGKRIIL